MLTHIHKNLRFYSTIVPKFDHRAGWLNLLVPVLEEKYPSETKFGKFQCYRQDWLCAYHKPGPCLSLMTALCSMAEMLFCSFCLWWLLRCATQNLFPSSICCLPFFQTESSTLLNRNFILEWNYQIFSKANHCEKVNFTWNAFYFPWPWMNAPSPENLTKVRSSCFLHPTHTDGMVASKSILP